MKYLAPALHQGIELLDTLNQKESLSLEELSKATKQPKSTMLRILDTLDRHGWVRRDHQTKQYESLVSVRFKSDFSFFKESELQKELDALAKESGCTAEWYQAMDRGMTITLRSEPKGSDVFVVARIGFVRLFDKEFDAVNRVAALFNLHPPRKDNFYPCYAKRGMSKIETAEMEKLLEGIKENHLTFDEEWNSRGVRRFAVGICTNDQKLKGIISLAESFTPNADEKIEKRILLLEKIKLKLEASEKL